MQTAEQFMLDFFRGRAGDARRFFAAGCQWAGSGTPEQAADELIVSTAPSNGGMVVVTHPISSFRALRYHLRPAGASWLIWNVEAECPSCHGNSGDVDCDFCAGKGWCGSEAAIEAAPLPAVSATLPRRGK